MKAGKIILALLLLILIGKESIRAGYQIGSFTSPGIILGSLLILILIAWLFGSSISKDKLKLKSWNFLKYYLISFFAFLIVAFFNMGSYKAPKENVEYNGINISIGEFYTMTKRMYPNDEERKAYVLCVVSKLAYSEEIVKIYRTELETGKINKIFQELQGQAILEEIGLKDCIGDMVINWSASTEKQFVRSMKDELYGTEFEETNDIEEYCNCIMKEFKKFPLSEVSSDEFQIGELKQQIIDKCKEETLK